MSYHDIFNHTASFLYTPTMGGRFTGAPYALFRGTFCVILAKLQLAVSVTC